MIGPGALHLAFPVLDTAPEIAAAHDQSHLNAQLGAVPDSKANLSIKLKSRPVPLPPASASPLILMSTRR